MVVMMSRSLLSPFLQRQHSFHCLSFHCREIASLTVPPADSGRLHLVQFVLNNAFCSLRDAGRNVWRRAESSIVRFTWLNIFNLLYNIISEPDDVQIK